MFCKNLCDKVLKIKNWRCTFYSFFRALCHGVLCFFCQYIFMEKIAKVNRLFSALFKKVKTDDFVSWFFPWKMCQLKKWSTPRWTARKKQENSDLSFFIVKTLSQRFLQNIFRNFQFFEKNKNDNFAVTHSN